MIRSSLPVIFRLLAAAVLAGCGSSSDNSSSGDSAGTSQPLAGASFAFASSFDTNTISTLKVDPSTGQLSAGGTDASTGACTGPYYLEVHSSGKFLFAACQSSNSAASFSIEQGTGALTMVGSPVAAGTSPGLLELHPNGNFLYLTNIGSSGLSAYAIGVDGALSEIQGSPYPTGATPYSVKVNEAGTFLYVTNRDSNNITVFAVDAVTGALTEIPGSPFASGLGARSIELSGGFAFVANRFADNVSVFAVDATSGALTPISGSPFPAGDDPRALALDPAGKYLYAVESSRDAGTTDIIAYSIDASTGALTQIAGSPFPVNINLLSGVPLYGEMDKMGNLLYVNNSASNSVSVYRVDRSTGALQRIQVIGIPGIASSVALM
jgi:6-phosphogluconolactonase